MNGNPAAIIAHENVLARMTAANRPVTERPLNTFFEDGRDFSFNGEAVFIYHVPGAHTDGDSVVYFRGSDVLVAGDMFLTTHLSRHRPGGGRRRRRLRRGPEQDARHRGAASTCRKAAPT